MLLWGKAIMWEGIESKDNLVQLFTSVLKCERCPNNSVKRDGEYNIPQPGWVGRNFSGVMFVGQNPGEGSTPPTEPDRLYLEALREVKDINSLSSMHDQLKEAANTFVYYILRGSVINTQSLPTIKSINV